MPRRFAGGVLVARALLAAAAQAVGVERGVEGAAAGDVAAASGQRLAAEDRGAETLELTVHGVRRGIRGSRPSLL